MRGTSSTPKTADTGRARHPGKRPRPGSDSSVDAELSYLDLDTGRVLESSRAKSAEHMSISMFEFDTMMSKLTSMEKGFSKLDKLDKQDAIETSVNTLSAKMFEFEDGLKTNETVTQDLKASVNFMSDKYDDVMKGNDSIDNKLSDCSASIERLKTENQELRQSLTELSNINSSLKESMIDLKCRSMRDNLVFNNIPEHFQTNAQGKRFEDTENELCKFLNDRLEVTGIRFERVHRLGPNMKPGMPARTGPRPIVAKFTFFKDRELVRRSAYKLKGTTFGINEQFPDEVEQVRRTMYPLVRQLRRDNKRAVLVRDQLYVNGKPISRDAALQSHRAENTRP